MDKTRSLAISSTGNSLEISPVRIRCREQIRSIQTKPELALELLPVPVRSRANQARSGNPPAIRLLPMGASRDRCSTLRERVTWRACKGREHFRGKEITVPSQTSCTSMARQEADLSLTLRSLGASMAPEQRERGRE